MRPAGLTIIFLIALLYGWWPVVIVLATWVAYWHPAWWLFAAAVVADAYMGTFATVPVLSLSIGAFAILVEVLKLYLLGQTV